MCPEKQCVAILLLFLSTSINDLTLVMNLYWIDSLFTATLQLKPSALSRDVSDLHLPQLSSCHDDSPHFHLYKQADNKCE